MTEVYLKIQLSVCHTLVQLAKMMAEIKYNPLGKGQMANNCV